MLDPSAVLAVAARLQEGRVPETRADFGASAPAPSPRLRFDELQSAELQAAAPARAASFGARVLKGVRPIDLRAG